MHHDSDQLETRTVGEYLDRDGIQFSAQQAEIGEAIARVLCEPCKPSMAYEREAEIERLLRAGEARLRAGEGSWAGTVTAAVVGGGR